MTRAEGLFEAGKSREAAEMIRRYLELRPDDTQARIALADRLHEGATTGAERRRAVEAYLDCLRRLGENDEVRRKLARLLIEVGNFSLAESQADRLLIRVPNDPAALRDRAVALYGMARESGRIPLTRVAAALQQAVQQNPRDLELAVGLAQMYRLELNNLPELERNESADEVLDGLVAADPENPRVWLARYEYRQQFGLADADADLDQAQSLAAEDLEVILAAGKRALERREWAQAEEFLARAIQTAPGERRGYLLRGEAQWQAGNRDQALATWRAGLVELGPNDYLLNLRLTEALIATGNLADADRTIQLLAGLLPKLTFRLSDTDRWEMEAAVALLRAQWHLARGEATAAADLVRQALDAQRVTAGQTAGMTTRIRLLASLANCFTELREPDAAGRIWDDVIALEPDQPRHHYLAGRAWEAAGQWQRAIAAYNQATRLAPPVGDAWCGLARVELRRQRETPAESRDWRSVEAALAEARRAPDVDPRGLSLVEADLAAARGSADEARARLAAVGQAADPDSSAGATPTVAGEAPAGAAWEPALIAASGRWGDPAEADRRWQEWEQTHGRSTQSVLLRVAVLVERGQPAAASDLLTEWLPQAPPAEQVTLRYQQAHVAWRAGDGETTRRHLAELLADRPRELLALRKIGLLAWQADDWDAVRTAAELLGEIEGPEATWQRFLRAQDRLAHLDPSQETSELEAVDELVREMLVARPTWPPALFVAGQVAELEGQFEAAILSYEQALGSREVGPRAIERLVLVLDHQGRLAEAERYLARLHEAGLDEVASEELTAVAIRVASRQGERDRALELARAAVQARPRDPEALVWLAKAQVLNDQVADAEAALWRAIEVAPGQGRWWLFLMEFYRQGQALDRLGELPAKLAGTTDLAPADREVLAGRARELLGEAAPALDHYRHGLELDSTDPDLTELAARALATSDPDLALSAMTRLVERAPRRFSARRALVELLLERGGQQAKQQAWEVTQAGRRGHVSSPEQLRLEARVLLARGGASDLAAALERLEQLVARPAGVVADDRFLLARLYQSQGGLDAARKQYAVLVSGERPQPEHLAAYLDLLLDQEELSESERRLAQLTALDPAGRATLALRVRWLRLAGRASEIAPLVDPALEQALAEADSDRARADLLVEFSRINARAGQEPPAEQCLRRAVEFDRGQAPRLIAWLAARGRASEALDFGLADGLDQLTAPMAAAIGQLVISGQARPEDLARIEPTIAAAHERFPEDAELAFVVGTLRYRQNRLDEAAAIYERILEIDPNHVPALNNLAMLYSADLNRQGLALEYINRALELAGALPALFDTQGVVLLRQGRVDEARESLTAATAAADADPVSYVHLSMAYLAGGAEPEARAALLQARQRQLDETQLMPPEQAALVELEGELNRVQAERLNEFDEPDPLAIEPALPE